MQASQLDSDGHDRTGLGIPLPPELHRRTPQPSGYNTRRVPAKNLNIEPQTARKRQSDRSARGREPGT